MLLHFPRKNFIHGSMEKAAKECLDLHIRKNIKHEKNRHSRILEIHTNQLA